MQTQTAINANDIKLKLTWQIQRMMADKYPDYAHDIAVTNDIMWNLIHEKLEIEYNGHDAKILTKLA